MVCKMTMPHFLLLLFHICLQFCSNAGSSCSLQPCILLNHYYIRSQYQQLSSILVHTPLLLWYSLRSPHNMRLISCHLEPVHSTIPVTSLASRQAESDAILLGHIGLFHIHISHHCLIIHLCPSSKLNTVFPEYSPGLELNQISGWTRVNLPIQTEKSYVF